MNIRLILFFTYGISLRTWAEIGLIDREILLYKRLIEKGIKVTFITYGDEKDYTYRDKLGDIEIVPFYAYTKRPKSRILRILHSLFLPFILRKNIKEGDIIKTNQIGGGWVVQLAKFFYRKKMIARCGYEPYRFTLAMNNSFWCKTLQWLNSWSTYKFSDKITVSSKVDRDFVVKTFGIYPDKITIFMNYIDTNLFAKRDFKKFENKLLFIGRLNEQKNIFSLLDAISETDYKLDIIGDGSLGPAIEAYIKKYNIKANLLGRFPNAQLPVIINRYPIYILPSYYEGNPKTLLEAMACGSAVIGTNVEGIKEIIKNKENGLLCETDADSIRQAIDILMQDEGLRRRLGENARSFIEKNCSLDRIVNKEYRLYRGLLGKNV